MVPIRELELEDELELELPELEDELESRPRVRTRADPGESLAWEYQEEAAATGGWTGSPEQRAFREQVLNVHLARSKRRSGPPQPDGVLYESWRRYSGDRPGTLITRQRIDIGRGLQVLTTVLCVTAAAGRLPCAATHLDTHDPRSCTRPLLRNRRQRRVAAHRPHTAPRELPVSESAAANPHQQRR